MNISCRNETVTLPLFLGQCPPGTDEYCIVTDASDSVLARRMGVTYVPKLSEATGSASIQFRQAAHDIADAAGWSYIPKAEHYVQHVQPAGNSKRMKPDQGEHDLCRH